MSELGYVIIISGPSGVGKGTLIAKLCERFPRLKLAVSATTRLPRDGEVDGCEYHFLTLDDFNARIDRGEFVEWCTVHGNLYGTLRQEIDKTVLAGDNVLLEIDVQGAKKVVPQFNYVVRIFIAPPSDTALLERLRHRNTESEEALARRLEAASRELQEQKDYDYVVINRDIETAFQELVTILKRLKNKEINDGSKRKS